MFPDFTVELIFKKLLLTNLGVKLKEYIHISEKVIKIRFPFLAAYQGNAGFFFFFSFLNPNNKLQHSEFKSECENLPIFYCQTLRSFTKNC